MLRQEELAFIEAISTLQLSPALVKGLRMALSSRRKKSAVSAGSAALRPEVVSKPPNVHPACTRASEKPTSWQVQASRSSPPTGAQRLALGPRLCPRAHHQSRKNKLQAASGNTGLLREGDVRGRIGRPQVPIQPSGSLTPITRGSDLSAPAVSFETANRHMSSDMSGPLSDRPGGTT